MYQVGAFVRGNQIFQAHGTRKINKITHPFERFLRPIFSTSDGDKSASDNANKRTTMRPGNDPDVFFSKSTILFVCATLVLDEIGPEIRPRGFSIYYGNTKAISYRRFLKIDFFFRNC